MAFDPYNKQELVMFNGEPVSVYVQKRLTRYPQISNTAEFKSYVDVVIDDMVAQITAWMAGGKIPTNQSTQRVTYPDGVWQMFKQQYMPHWFTRKFPVRNKEVVVTTATNHYFVCPHINVPARDSRHIQFMATGSPIAEQMSHE